MQIAIIFYSFSGGTRKACEFLKERLLQVNIQAELIELRLKQEETYFFRQCNAARTHQALELKNLDYDLSKYDFLIFSSPVWAFTFTPALRSFIERCSGLANKKAAVFLTCGSAMTSGGALKELRNFLTRKGADVKFTAYVKGVNTGNREYLENKFKRLSVYLV